MPLLERIADMRPDATESFTPRGMGGRPATGSSRKCSTARQPVPRVTARPRSDPPGAQRQCLLHRNRLPSSQHGGGVVAEDCATTQGLQSAGLAGRPGRDYEVRDQPHQEGPGRRGARHSAGGGHCEPGSPPSAGQPRASAPLSAGAFSRASRVLRWTSCPRTSSSRFPASSAACLAPF